MNKVFLIFHYLEYYWLSKNDSFSLEEFIYNYLITLSFYIIPKKGV